MTTKLPAGSSLDLINKSGSYAVESPVGAPIEGDWFAEIRTANINGISCVAQRITHAETGAQYSRNKGPNGAWAEWAVVGSGVGGSYDITALDPGSELEAVTDSGLYSVLNPPGLLNGKYFVLTLSDETSTVQYAALVTTGAVKYRALADEVWTDWTSLEGGGAPADPAAYLIIFNGESNAGGYALNSELTEAEEATRTGVQIFNNTSLAAFDSLLVGTNNLVGHALLTNNATHGFEVSLANAVDAGRFGEGPVYLLKTGQGGSLISEWLDIVTDGEYGEIMIERMVAAKLVLAGLGVTVAPYVMVSIGINDGIAGTVAGDFQADLVTHLANIRGEMGSTTRIVLTKFNAPLGTAAQTFNTQIDTVAAAQTFSTAISTADATVRDSTHWDAQGYRVIGERIWDAFFGGTAVAEPVLEIDESGLAVLTGEGTIKYTTDGSTPHSGSATYSAPVQLADGETIRAVRLGVAAKNSIEVTDTYVASGPVTEVVTWQSLQNATIDGEYVDSNGSAPGGAISTQTIDGTAAFNLVWYIPSDAAAGSVVVALDTDDDTNYGWNSGAGQAHLEGLIWASGNLFRTGGTFAALNGTAVAAPFYAKMEKSGDDLVMSRSGDGVTWTPYQTRAGILAGQTNLNVKLIFGVANATRTMRVELTR